MAQLVIDQGNTRCKVGLWRGANVGGDVVRGGAGDGAVGGDVGEGAGGSEGEDDGVRGGVRSVGAGEWGRGEALSADEGWSEWWVFDKFDVAAAADIFANNRCIESGIYCSTAAQDEDLETYLQSKGCLIFGHTTPTPLVNDYKSPSTLGLDRLANAIGAADRFVGRNLIIFDLGSAITIDFVSGGGHFLGGNISAGLSMRLDALHQFTGRLPVVDAVDDENLHYGIDTKSALVMGAVQGICNEIDGYIDQNRDKTVIFTGGDAHFFEIRIKNTIFVDCELTANGLLSILRYNA